MCEEEIKLSAELSVLQRKLDRTSSTDPGESKSAKKTWAAAYYHNPAFTTKPDNESDSYPEVSSG